MERHDEELRLGRNLREARKRSGLTQKRLADLAGLDRATISQIENGHESPRAHTVVVLAVVLGVRPAELWRDAPGGWGPGVRSTGGEKGVLQEKEALHYEPLHQSDLHPGLLDLLGDEKTRALMQISDEEALMLRSIRTRQDAPLDKEFFIDVLLAFRRSHER